MGCGGIKEENVQYLRNFQLRLCARECCEKVAAVLPVSAFRSVVCKEQGMIPFVSRIDCSQYALEGVILSKDSPTPLSGHLRICYPIPILKLVDSKMSSCEINEARTSLTPNSWPICSRSSRCLSTSSKKYRADLVCVNLFAQAKSG